MIICVGDVKMIAMEEDYNRRCIHEVVEIEKYP